MTGPEHFREAERLTREADEWLDADWGWKADLSSEERIARRNSDLAAAQVHATLALAAAMAPTSPLVGDQEMAAWHAVAGHGQAQEGGAS